jgi:transaldolase
MVNVTLCFSAGQAILAAKAGAAFISPFVGRLDDIGLDGMALIADIVEIYRQYVPFQDGGPGRLDPPSACIVVEAAKIGAHVATCRPTCCASSIGIR